MSAHEKHLINEMQVFESQLMAHKSSSIPVHFCQQYTGSARRRFVYICRLINLNLFGISLSDGNKVEKRIKHHILIYKTDSKKNGSSVCKSFFILFFSLLTFLTYDSWQVQKVRPACICVNKSFRMKHNLVKVFKSNPNYSSNSIFVSNESCQSQIYLEFKLYMFKNLDKSIYSSRKSLY